MKIATSFPIHPIVPLDGVSAGIFQTMLSFTDEQLKELVHNPTRCLATLNAKVSSDMSDQDYQVLLANSAFLTDVLACRADRAARNIGKEPPCKRPASGLMDIDQLPRLGDTKESFKVLSRIFDRCPVTPEPFNFARWFASVCSSLKNEHYLLEYSLTPYTQLPTIVTHPLLDADTEFRLVSLLQAATIPKSEVETSNRFPDAIGPDLSTLRDFFTAVYSYTGQYLHGPKEWTEDLYQTFLEPMIRVTSPDVTLVRKTLMKPLPHIEVLPGTCILNLLRATCLYRVDTAFRHSFDSVLASSDLIQATSTAVAQGILWDNEKFARFTAQVNHGQSAMTAVNSSVSANPMAAHAVAMRFGDFTVDQALNSVSDLYGQAMGIPTSSVTTFRVDTSLKCPVCTVIIATLGRQMNNISHSAAQCPVLTSYTKEKKRNNNNKGSKNHQNGQSNPAPTDQTQYIPMPQGQFKPLVLF